MGRVSIRIARRAIPDTVRSDAEKTTAIHSDVEVSPHQQSTAIAVQSDGDADDWFGTLARPLLAGCDGAFALETITGFLARTCGRYISKSPQSRRQPPGYFIRALLRSDQGAIWLAALMEGCDASWWRDHLEAAGKAQLLDRIRADLNKQV